jgi:predicted ATPase
MMTSLDIKNFKCFADLRVSFGKLTLLTGFNAGGKSSAMQPLLLLAQAMRCSTFPGQLVLNGPLVRLGTVGDVLPKNATQSNILFSVADTTEEVTWTTSARASDRHLNVVDLHRKSVDSGIETSQQSSADHQSTVGRSLIQLSYLSAVREGAADTYPMPDSLPQGVANVGADGRFAAYWYDKCVDDEIPVTRMHPNEPANSLRKQLDAWFATLFPGGQANVQHIAQASLENLQFRLTDIGAWQRPANVGYGFTYAFPILVALLTASEGQLVLIDSPEAHLHPSAQSKMGRLLAHFAATGVQVVAETHSDHLLNGVRLAVKESLLSADALRLHYFGGASEGQHGVQSLTIDRAGRIDSWPDGFFDQAEKDLTRLSGW